MELPPNIRDQYPGKILPADELPTRTERSPRICCLTLNVAALMGFVAISEDKACSSVTLR